MKKLFALAVVAATLSTSAFAWTPPGGLEIKPDDSIGYLQILAKGGVNVPNAWLRGTLNGREKTPMPAALSDQFGINYTTIINVPAGSHAYKFDSYKGDWSFNHGDNILNREREYCADRNGKNIPFAQGTGTYALTYTLPATQNSDIEQRCGKGSGFYVAVKLNSFTSKYRTMYLRTDAYGWKSIPMTLTGNDRWQGEIVLRKDKVTKFFLDSNGDGKTTFGLSTGGGVLAPKGLAVNMNLASKGMLTTPEDLYKKEVKVYVVFDSATNRYTYQTEYVARAILQDGRLMLNGQPLVSLE